METQLFDGIPISFIRRIYLARTKARIFGDFEKPWPSYSRLRLALSQSDRALMGLLFGESGYDRLQHICARFSEAEMEQATNQITGKKT